jgi:hypothetical protein
MSRFSEDRGSRPRRPSMRMLALTAVVALLVAGIVVTATAAPGPRTDVKTAQYGGPPTPPPTKGPCKGIGGEAGQTCLLNAKAQYKKALAKCAHKRPSQRAKCRRAAKKKWVG